MIAQTNLQLYNQLWRQGYTVDDLVGIRCAYDLLSSLYAGYYQADGKPFVAHGVGVASILGYLEMPAEDVTVGLLHNIYGNADFGDGRAGGITRGRRRIVRQAVGERLEALLACFQKQRITPARLQEIAGGCARLGPAERSFVLIDLADYLEKYLDFGVLYYGDNRWVTDVVAVHGAEFIDLARRLGEPKLAQMLTEAFEQASGVEIPAVLRTPPERRYLEFVMSRSCRRRLRPVLLQACQRTWQQVRARLRPRRQLRRLRRWLGRVRASCMRRETL